MKMKLRVTLLFLSALAGAQTYSESTLHSFGSSPTDGVGPEGTVVVDQAGNVYGLTLSGGGDNSTCGDGCGTIYKLDPAGNETTLHEFTSNEVDPRASLTMDAAGNLFGTSSKGGFTSQDYPQGLGFVFKYSATGKYSVLHRFAVGELEGADPWGPVTVDAEGNVYGTTLLGGDLGCLDGVGCGVIFKINSKGVYSVLYSFAGSPDGSQPIGNLLRNGVGDLYGTTSTGGTYGSGAVFELTASGEETVLFSLCDLNSCGNEGASPAYLVRNAEGNFYVNAFAGGSTNFGSIIEITGGGVGSVLYTFCPGGETSGCPNGDHPNGPIVAAGGDLFGTTTAGANGGSSGAGVVYKLSSSGVNTVLYRFLDDGSTGRDPQGISMDSAGNLYGTATGGPNGAGVVFKLTKH